MKPKSTRPLRFQLELKIPSGSSYKTIADHLRSVAERLDRVQVGPCPGASLVIRHDLPGDPPGGGGAIGGFNLIDVAS